MQPPTLQVTMRDEERVIEYQIYAYRPLSRAEAVLAIRNYNASRKRPPKRGSRVKIMTIIGHDGD